MESTLGEACENSRKRGLSARQMIMMGLQLCSQLDFHHSIEEQHIFPVLAKKMPEFRKELDLLSQHRQIHAGVEKLEKYLEQCRSGEEDMRREEVKRLMEGFGKVLWTHLDQEVQTLGAAICASFGLLLRCVSFLYDNKEHRQVLPISFPETYNFSLRTIHIYVAI